MRLKLPFLPAAIIALSLAGPVLAQELSVQEMTEADIKALALEAILENPQIVMEAVAILQARDTAEAEAQANAAVAGSRDILENDPNAPEGGNPDGSVTVVEFFDYNCGFCRRADPEVKALLAADTDVRIVYREWPILSEGSIFGARAALAAREQGKYAEMHSALMTSRGQVNETTVLSIAEDLGLDIERLRADMEAETVEAHLATSRELAETLGFTGTPSFVIGETRVPGFVEADQLQQIVDEAREEG